MKHIVTLAAVLAFCQIILPRRMQACPTCTPTSDSWISSITHGRVPEQMYDVAIVSVAAAFLAATAIYTIVLLRRGRVH